MFTARIPTLTSRDVVGSASEALQPIVIGSFEPRLLELDGQRENAVVKFGRQGLRIRPVDDLPRHGGGDIYGAIGEE